MRLEPDARRLRSFEDDMMLPMRDELLQHSKIVSPERTVPHVSTGARSLLEEGQLVDEVTRSERHCHCSAGELKHCGE